MPDSLSGNLEEHSVMRSGHAGEEADRTTVTNTSDIACSGEKGTTSCAAASANDLEKA
jgi:hypothetical protein